MSIRLLSLRQEKDVSQRELSRQSGVGLAVIQRIEKNPNYDAKLSTLTKLSNYFTVSLDYLCGMSEIRNYSDKTNEAIHHFVEEMKKL